jgi:hypothetical protein
MLSSVTASTALSTINFQAFSASRKSFMRFKHACTRLAIFTVSLSQ